MKPIYIFLLFIFVLLFSACTNPANPAADGTKSHDTTAAAAPIKAYAGINFGITKSAYDQKKRDVPAFGGYTYEITPFFNKANKLYRIELISKESFTFYGHVINRRWHLKPFDSLKNYLTRVYGPAGNEGETVKVTEAFTWVNIWHQDKVIKLGLCYVGNDKFKIAYRAYIEAEETEMDREAEIAKLKADSTQHALDVKNSKL